MSRAIDFFVQWTENKTWRKKIFNTVITKEQANIEELAKEIIDLFYSKEKIEVITPDEKVELNESKLWVEQISKPVNINALSSDTAFKLGKNLNVLYGENGSGKSSYVRTFRKLANNYYTQLKALNLLPNVYNSDVNRTQIQKIDISYFHNDKNVSETVFLDTPHDTLSQINVWDSESVIPLINSDLTFSVLPQGFEYFQLASEIIDQVRNHINEVIKDKQTQKDNLFIDSSFDTIRDEISQIISSELKTKDLPSFLQSEYPSSENFEEVIKEIEVQEKEFQAASHVDKIKLLKAQMNKLVYIGKKISELSIHLTEANINTINDLVKGYKEKLDEEKNINEAFKKGISVLENINKEWFEFIQSGGKYYDSINKQTPSEGDICIFCSQKLSVSGIEFISNNLNHHRNGLSQELDHLRKTLNKLDPPHFENLLNEEEKALIENKALVSKIEIVLQLLEKNRELLSKCITSNKSIDISSAIDVSDLLGEISNEITKIANRISVLEGDEQKINLHKEKLRTTKETIIKNKKINDTLYQFIQYIDFSEECNRLNKVKNALKTGPLTRNARLAFDSIVKDDYLDIFQKHCSDLQISNVSIQLTPSKGKNLRRKYVASEQFKVSDVMSEGEQKAIAMVEFATDITIRKNYNTVLFDDPVTSLDYKRAELFANLIFMLSKERQVIVFTHNIMFYYYLYNLAKSEKNKENKFFKVDEFDSNNKGIVSESFSGRLETLKEVTNKIKNHKNIIDSKTCIGDELEERLKGCYSEIRTWCELIVEEGFFKQTIRRYEPNIMFSSVRKINVDFVNELIPVSDLFDKSCRWMLGHSQPIETQMVKANREAFLQDFAYIMRVYETFK